MAITSIPVLSDISRTPLIFAGEVDKFNSLISKYTALTTSGFQTFTSSSSGQTYNTVANGGETELLSILINAINSANGNNPCIFTAGHFNSIKTTLEAGANSGVNTDLWRGWKVYSSLGDLGLSGTPTVETIIQAMADLSILNCSIGTNSNFPANFGQLFVIRISSSFAYVSYSQNANTSILFTWLGQYNASATPTFTGFKEIYNGGNYDVWKPISSNYTLTSNDNGKNLYLAIYDATNITITVPHGLPENFRCTVTERTGGTGQTTFAPIDGTVFINSNPDNTRRTLNGKSAKAYIAKYPSADVFDLCGNLKA